MSADRQCLSVAASLQASQMLLEAIGRVPSCVLRQAVLVWRTTTIWQGLPFGAKLLAVSFGS